MKNRRYRIGAVLFDFDGTLTRPGALDFKTMRQAIGCPAGMPMLEFIQSISDRARRRTARRRLEAFEIEGSKASQANPGASALIARLKAQGMPMGIVTRNSRASVLRAMENFERIHVDDFDLILTRDDPLPLKPSGAGIVWAAGRLKQDVDEILMVGDFIFDMQAGRAAGALTALLDPRQSPDLAETICDFRIRHLKEIEAIVNAGLPPAGGKTTG